MTFTIERIGNVCVLQLTMKIKSSFFLPPCFPSLPLREGTLFPKPAADTLCSGSEDLNITKEIRHRNIKTVDSN